MLQKKGTIQIIILLLLVANQSLFAQQIALKRVLVNQ